MPTCPQCGAKNPRENTVCRNCGAVLGVELPPSPPPSVGVGTSEAGPQQVQRCSSCGAEIPPDGAVFVPKGGNGGTAALCPTCAAQTKVSPDRWDRPDEASISPSPEAEEAVPLSPDAVDLPIARAALYGVGAAVACGALWYLLESLWTQELIGPIAGFATAWIIGLAVVLGADRKRGRPLQLLSLGIAALSILVVQFLVYTTLRDVPPESFFPTWWQNTTAQIIGVVFILLALWQAYTTPGARPQRAQQQEPSSTEVGVGSEAGKEAAEEAAETEAGAETAALKCVRCQSPTAPEEALVLPGRRGTTIAVCPNCVAELEAQFAAETEDLQINQAVLYGLGAAILTGVVWYLVEYFSGWPLAFIAWLGAWGIAEAVRYGAGRKRGRPLQWISLGLTLAMIVVTLVSISLRGPEGLLPTLGARMQDLFTTVLLLLALWQAFSVPAPRQLPRPRRPRQ